MRELLQTKVVAHSGQKVHLRFQPVMHVLDGTSFGTVCEMSKRFEEKAAFGPAAATQSATGPAKWLADRLLEVASAAHTFDNRMRPIIVPAPAAALGDDNTAVGCDAAIRRTTLCQQEISLEFQDSVFADGRTEAIHSVASLRKRGFRVSIDMRKSWQTQLRDGLGLMIDSIRVDARELQINEELMDLCEFASAAGILVIADKANWRDGAFFDSLGVQAGVRMRTDC
ncbi:EAL domain-containing protein [Hyphomonas sp.]|jgi:EAL domain-containing protein (putative c-di-GMP-specific phosphodiesterase class I)|uniref:EAL domain-containing protein n=1 Tax=Hyphomonas sp. TaxID=87 RepID=UPI000E08C42D|nr:EAL domain-containing protein [Hyphomonas sp.]MDF1804793.1 EAL domain-containing protein [Hyphomonas sp.]RCL88275.1 MAG: EAL domain-containing protein [Hyphomonas sp.]